VGGTVAFGGKWIDRGVEHASLLLDRLDVQAGQVIADLGCGWG